MNYLQLKKRAFMKVVNSIKGMVRTASGIPPLMLEDCVDNDSLIGYTIYGNSIQDGTPSPEAPVEVESVGELNNLFNPNDVMKSTVIDVTIIDDCSFIATSKKESTTNTFMSLVKRVDYENLLGKKCEFCAEIEKSADYIVSGVVFQWVDSAGKVKTPYPLDYSTTKFGKNVTFTMPDTPPDGAVYLNMTFMLARTSTVAIGDTVTFKNVSFYSIDEKYKIPVTCRGKNLYADGDKNFTAMQRFTLSKPIKAGTYTLSALFDNDSDTYNSGLFFYANQAGSSLGNLTYPKGGRISRTVTFAEDIYQLIFYATTAGSTNAGVNATYKDIQIEEGSVATEYEPYVEPVTTYIYLAEPLGIGEVISYPETAGVPKLPTIKGTTVYEIDTIIQPSQMDVTYYSNAKGD